MNYEFWRRPDHPQVAGRNREDEAERQDGPPGAGPLEDYRGGGYYHDGPGKGRGEDDRGVWSDAGLQGIFRLSVRTVYLDQRRDRARDSVGEAGAENGRYRNHRLWSGFRRILRRCRHYGAGGRRGKHGTEKAARSDRSIFV